MEWVKNDKLILELKQQDQEKDQFLCQVTHDLRAPLNVVNYLLEQIDDLSRNNNQIQKSIEMCRSNSNMMMSLINDILDYAQLKEDQMKLNIQSFSIQDTLEEIKEMLQIQFDLKNIKLIFKNQINPINDTIYSDQRRLKQVIINLLTNALKFTPKGEVTVISKNVGEDNKLLKFFVQDTGIGIEEEKVKAIGVPYITFNSQNLNGNGIGMGLFICKKIIGKLGPSSDLFIESTIGKGTKFGFIIYQSIQSENDNSIYNFKSFFQLTPQYRSGVFSFEKIGYQTDEIKMKKKICTFAQTPNIRFQKISFKRQQSLLQENYEKQIDFPVKKFKKTEFKIEKELQEMNEFSEQNDVKYYTPYSYETKPKKLINNQIDKNIQNESEEEKSLPENYCILETEEISENADNSKIIIMIADDNSFNQLIIETYLKEIEFDIQIVKVFNGHEAKELFIKHNSVDIDSDRIQVIIMDCQMPILDGYQATKQIKELIETNNYYECQIIAYTGNSGIEEEKKCKFAGFDSYLFKPAKKNDLIMAVMNYL